MDVEVFDQGSKTHLRKGKMKRLDRLFDQICPPGYEQVYFFDQDEFHAIIAIHSTKRGPAFGGVRVAKYETRQEAHSDALRLARGMTYTSAAFDIPFGGGAAVIMQKGETNLQLFGQCVQQLDGRYISAPDVGTDAADMQLLQNATPHALGLLAYCGNPAAYAAEGVLLGIERLACALREHNGNVPLNELRIGIQGLGKVGGLLAEKLIQRGCYLWVADKELNKAAALKEQYPTQVDTFPEHRIFKAPVDIMAPCAVGGVLNPVTIAHLNKKIRIIAGGANNQLEDDARDSDLLRKNGRVYAVDFLLNAGGVIAAHEEYSSRKEGREFDKQRVLQALQAIPRTLEAVLAQSYKEEITPWQAAMALAESRLR